MATEPAPPQEQRTIDIKTTLGKETIDIKGKSQVVNKVLFFFWVCLSKKKVRKSVKLRFFNIRSRLHIPTGRTTKMVNFNFQVLQDSQVSYDSEILSNVVNITIFIITVLCCQIIFCILSTQLRITVLVLLYSKFISH